MLIGGPGFVEGQKFTAAFGIFDNFTIAGGIPHGSLVWRDGQTLFDAVSELFAAIRRDFELVRYDYSYQIAEERRRYGGGESISVDGRHGMISLRPKGYCSIQFVDHKEPTLVDLRSKDGFLTDSGSIRLYRRKAEVLWLEILPPLLKFLEDRLEKKLSLEHIDRVV